MRTREPFARTPQSTRLACRSASGFKADPLAWLASRPHPHLYWNDRATKTVWAGSGIAIEETAAGPGAIREALGRVREHLARFEAAGPRPRFFGGGAFDPREDPGERWAGFPGARFLLPHALLRCAPEECEIAVFGADERALDRALEEEREAAAAPRRRPRVKAHARRAGDAAAWMRWQERIAGALRAIEGEEVQKVVIARNVLCEADDRFDSASLLEALGRRDERSVPFLFDFGTGGAFAGATPELLLRTRGKDAESECVAGTAARGETSLEDEASAAAVLSSEKDRREHDYVVSAVRDAFEAWCTGVTVDLKPELLTLSSVHHLRVGVRGRLRSEGAVEDLLAALHPTPAVGGTPRERALDLLHALEGESRGWYAGPVGWIEAGASEFMVAIRSALLTGRQARVFAGSGIVQGSTAESEWAETEAKARPMIAALMDEG